MRSSSSKLLLAQIQWWWVTEQYQLRQQTATMRLFRLVELHNEAKATRLYRGYVMAAEVIGVLVTVGTLYVLGIWWA